MGAAARELSSGVTAVYSTRSAFAALKEDGRVVTWGSHYLGICGPRRRLELSGSFVSLTNLMLTRWGFFYTPQNSC